MVTPTVDISAITSSSSSTLSEQHRETAKTLTKALSTNGYVGITGHGLPSDLTPLAFRLTKKLFALPHDDKLQGSGTAGPGAPPRGFSPAGIEHAGKAYEEKEGKPKQGTTAADYKETFDVGTSSPAAAFPNAWLPESTLPGFQSFMVGFYAKLDALCHTILDTLMLGMGFNESECKTVKKLHTGLDNQLRLAHYLPLQQQMLETDGATRLAAHRDWSSFTLLFQDVHAGLEFQDRSSDQFILAPPKDGVLYLNVGDMLERISNVTHAANGAGPGSTSVPSRFSIPYFFLPSPDGLIAPQETRVKEDGKAKYEAMTFKEYSERMFLAARGEKGDE